MLRILLEGGFVRILCKRLYEKMNKKKIIAVLRLGLAQNSLI